MKKIDRKEIKERAKKILSGNIWNVLKPGLVIALISLCVNTIISNFFVTSVDCSELFYFKNFDTTGITCTTTNAVGSLLETILALVIIVLSVGYSLYLLNVVRNKKASVKNDLFKFFKENLGVCLGTGILIGIFTALWSILLIIPGIIAALSYSMSYYLLADGRNKVMDTIRESKNMMKGHKWEYFVFNLSFLGWILLSIFTLGIALIYVAPYMSVSQALYYEELKTIK